MALIKCGECGHRVATDAPSCPSCGHRMPPPRAFELRQPGRKKPALIILGLILLLGFLGSLTKGGGSSNLKSGATAPSASAAMPKKPDPLTRYADRQRFADTYEKQMLLKGVDMHASAEGPQARTLKLRYILAGRPLAYQISQDHEIMANLQSLGFREVIVTDGYDETHIIDIDPLPGDEETPSKAPKSATRKRYQWVGDPTLEVAYYATPQCRPARELVRTKRGQTFATIDEAFGVGYRRSDIKACDD